MSKSDFERGKMKGVADWYRFQKWFKKNVPWKIILFILWSLIAYGAGSSSVVCGI